MSYKKHPEDKLEQKTVKLPKNMISHIDAQEGENFSDKLRKIIDKSVITDAERVRDMLQYLPEEAYPYIKQAFPEEFKKAIRQKVKFRNEVDKEFIVDLYDMPPSDKLDLSSAICVEEGVYKFPSKYDWLVAKLYLQHKNIQHTHYTKEDDYGYDFYLHIKENA
jgi:hypothetical protein